MDSMNLGLELEQARRAATTLHDLERQADRLPALEEQALQEQRIKLTTARLDQAVATHRSAARESRAKMQDYHQRLGPILAELDALARILGEVGDTMRDAVVRVNSACHALGQAQAPATEDYHRAALNASASESVLDDLNLVSTDDLTPWTRNPRVDALVKLIVDHVAARGGTVYDPVFVTRLY